MKTYNKKVLIIDGDYFGHRLIHGIRINQKDFNLSTDQQRNNFITMLQNSFGSIVKSFNNDYQQLVDNFVFVFDSFSWRKGYKYPVLDSEGNETDQYEFLKPYYINDDTALGYKDNRAKLRETNDVDWKAFSECLDEFRLLIEPVIPCLKSEGAEGDDNLFFVTNEFTKLNYLSIIFANDGDLKSLVNDNVVYLKNVKSNQSPDGEVVISKNIFDDLFSKKSVEELFLNQNNFDKEYFMTLFKIDIANSGNRIFKDRKVGDNIYATEHKKDLLEKIICGDKKDNIFPIFRWGSSSRNFKPTNKMIQEAFESYDFMDFTEDNVELAFNDDKMMSCILDNISNQVASKMKISKSDFIKIAKGIPKHYRHNLKMNSLSYNSIPTYVYNNFMDIYNNNVELINTDWSEERLLSIVKILSTYQNRDNAKELMISSVTDIDDILGTETVSTNPIVQSILDS